MSLAEIKFDAGLSPSAPRASKAPTPASSARASSAARSAINLKPGIMDLRPSKSLATGLKRVGGRSGTSRLGNFSRRGKPIVEHKY